MNNSKTANLDLELGISSVEWQGAVIIPDCRYF